MVDPTEAPSSGPQAPADAGCICRGNWRLIVKECEREIGHRFVSSEDDAFTFFGLVHAADDYYYGLWSPLIGLRMISCVGDLYSSGYRLIDEPGYDEGPPSNVSSKEPAADGLGQDKKTAPGSGP